MPEIILAGEPNVTIEVRRSGRARRLSLRVSRLDGKVTLTLPNWTQDREAREFAISKQNWIVKQLSGHVAQIIPQLGGAILFEGVETPIRPGEGRTVQYVQSELRVPGATEKVPAKLAAYLKIIARQRLARACDWYSGELGRPYGRVTLRDTRSRWGSCTSAGDLMFSWRLVMAPPEVLDYVAAHEVAHLLEMNHSAAYWANVRRVFPDYETPRRWLRENAAALHAYQFRN